MSLASGAKGIAAVFAWSRVRFTFAASLGLGAFLSLLAVIPAYVVIGRALIVGFAVVLVFGLFEQWPQRLPPRLARWVLQLIGIVIIVPFAAWFAYWATTGGQPRIGEDQQVLTGYLLLTFTGILFAPWLALGAMLRQRDAFAQRQALAFALERSELERKAADARLRLLQAQVQPHFLFNTLANVKALVDTGSAQASTVLDNLIAYLRAAVPRLNEPSTTLGNEVELVNAYLTVMQMRMPDRLQFAVRIEPHVQRYLCPPMTLLALVENAVRHGIDPSETGGRIDVDITRSQSRCRINVVDTGVGLQANSRGLGTGLSTLRERLLLFFGPTAQLRLLELQPHGMQAAVEFPILEAGA